MQTIKSLPDQNILISSNLYGSTLTRDTHGSRSASSSSFGPSNPAILLWVFQTLNTEIRVSKGLLIILSGHAIAKEETKSSCDGQKNI